MIQTSANRKSSALPMGLLVVAYLALCLAYGMVVPPFEGLDEVEHFGVVRYVSDTGSLPVQGDPALAAYHIRQEASQPPLYYLLAGPLLRLTGISTADAGSYLTPNPYVTCGDEAVRFNKATLRHDPFAKSFLAESFLAEFVLAESFPWRGALSAVHLLRALSTLLQAFTVAGVYAIARRVFDRPGVPLLAAALTAFNPQFLIVASNVNNDNIATPIVTWAIYVTVLVAQEGVTFRRALVLGVLIGLAALAKLTGLLLLPLAALALIVSPIPSPRVPLRADRTNSRPVSRFGYWAGTVGRITWAQFPYMILVGSVTAAVAGWWYVRNWQLYGDLSGLAPMLDIVGRRGPVPLGLLLSEGGLVFRSFWGQLPCAFFDSALYYSAWVVVTALGLFGLVWRTIRKGPATGVAPYILVVWLILVLAGWLRWDLTTPAPGGRLLFTAVGAISTLLAFGLTSLPFVYSPRSTLFAYAGSAAMAMVGLLALLAWVRPLFAPPPLVDAASVRPQHPLQAQFGESIGLLGYDLRADAPGPGRWIDVTLYWRALGRMSPDYVLALQLAAPTPGDTRTLLNFNTWPGGGNLPTAAWPVGPAIVDRYRLPLPMDTGVTQAWRFQVLAYNAQTGARLPLRLDAQPAGESLTLGTWRVKGAAPVALPDAARLASPVTFGQAVALTHADVEADARTSSARVRLLWQSLNPLPHDVTIFVHAYDAGGQLAATGDGPPMGGNYVTSLWQTGDLILDEHTLTLPGGLAWDDVRVTVGLYRPEDGVRLPAMQGATRLPADEMVIWPK